MTFAVGKHSQAICDRCGQQYDYLDLKKEWNGLLVCPECYEPKHPQLEPPYHAADAEALKNPRPAVGEATIAFAGAVPGSSAFESDGMLPAPQTKRLSVLTSLGQATVGPESTQIFTMTVAGKSGGGGNAYYTDGVEQRNFTFQVGQVRLFSFSDNSSQGHPMLLSDTSDGSHGGGSPYTTNVAYRLNGNTLTDQASYIAAFTGATQTRELILTVDSSTPTLYYYCTNHPAMGGSITII